MKVPSGVSWCCAMLVALSADALGLCSLGWGVVLVADQLLVEGLECNMVTGNGVQRLRQAVGAVTSRWGSFRFRAGAAAPWVRGVPAQLLSDPSE